MSSTEHADLYEIYILRQYLKSTDTVYQFVVFVITEKFLHRITQ
jgi:hypothetical protein